MPPDRNPSFDDSVDWRVVLIVFLLMCAVFSVRSLINLQSVPLFADSDDAMRLTIARDLMGGQGFWDHIQHRINAPFGAEIHWSRLIDLPLVGLLLLFSSLGPEMAANVTGFVWPLMLLGGLLALIAKLTTMLAGRDALLPGLILPVLAVPVISEFSPGRLDHHSIGILLSLGIVISLLGARKRPYLAGVCGLLCATALAIAVENLPVVTAAVLALGLGFVVDGRRAVLLRWFGLGLGVAILSHLMIALPPSAWLVAQCDALSPVYVLASVLTGLVFFALSLLPQGFSWRGRLGFGLAAGALVVLSELYFFPQCAAGPYGELDPWLSQNWLRNIAEAQPLFVAVWQAPAWAIGAVVPALMGLGVIVWRLWRGATEKREDWAVLGLFLALCLLVSLVQLRGARQAVLFMVPAGAWAILEARRYYLARGRPAAAVLLVAAWLLFSGVTYVAAVTLFGVLLPTATPAPIAIGPGNTQRVLGPLDCVQPKNLAVLTQFETQTLMAPIDMGSHIVMATPHSVLGAPYHRNAAGMLDTFRFFNLPIDKGRDILRARGIKLIVVCPFMPEMQGLGDAAPDSFVRLLNGPGLPADFEPVGDTGGVLRVFAFTG